MKTTSHNRKRRFFFSVLSGFILLPFFVALTSAAQAVESSSDADRFELKLREDLADCESKEAAFRAAMPEMTRIWNRQLALADEDKRERKVSEELHREWARAYEAYKEADIENKKFEERCREMWRRSGIPDGEWQARWHEIKECRDWDQFYKRVYERRASTVGSRERAYRESETRREQQISGERFKADREYEKILQQLGINFGLENRGDWNAFGPDENLKAITDRCARLRGEYRYDRDTSIAAVRAKAAIKECRFKDADEYIDDMLVGPEKVTLKRNLSEAKARAEQVYQTYQEGKKFYDRGRAEETAGRYDQARTLYREALARFGQARDMERCESRLPTIYTALSNTQKKIAQVTVRMTEAAIKQCKFTDAEKYIAEMPSGPERATLERSLSDAKARAQDVYQAYQQGRASYDRGRAEEAAGRYDQAKRLYQEALARFEQARDMERCESRLPTIAKALDLAQKRIDQVGTRQIQQQQARTQRFENPEMGGVPVDGCLHWAKDCGKPAADEFCRQKGFAESSTWGVEEYVPRTRVISSGEVCETGKNWRNCGRFSYIVCK